MKEPEKQIALIERLQKYGMTMPEFTSIDIYTLVKPLKKILSLNDLTQKSIEAFLDIKREDKYNGGELIHVYKDYVSLSTLLNSSENSMSIYEKRYVNKKNIEIR